MNGDGLLVRLGRVLDRAARAVVPDPFVLALLLTLVVIVFAIVFGDGAARAERSPRSRSLR